MVYMTYSALHPECEFQEISIPILEAILPNSEEFSPNLLYAHPPPPGGIWTVARAPKRQLKIEFNLKEYW